MSGFPTSMPSPARRASDNLAPNLFMKKPTAMAAAALTGGLVLAAYAHVGTAQAPSTPEKSAAGVKTVLNDYCATCHNAKLMTAGLDFESLDVARVGDHAEVWEKVATKVRTHEMPPPGRRRPD